MSSRNCFWLAAVLLAPGELLGLVLSTSEEPMINHWLPADQRVFVSLFLLVYGIVCPLAAVALLWVTAKKGVVPFLLGLASASTVILSGFCSALLLIPISHGHFEPLMLIPFAVFAAALAMSYGHTAKDEPTTALAA